MIQLEESDEAVMEKLDTAYLAHTLKKDPKWKIIVNWLRAERANAQNKLNNIDPTKMAEVVRHQETIRICNHLAEKIFVGIEKDGELALMEAQDRGLVPETTPMQAEDANTGA